VGVSQTLQRSTEGATYIRQGGHHVGHWPTVVVSIRFTVSVEPIHCFSPSNSCVGLPLSPSITRSHFFNPCLQHVLHTYFPP